MSEVELSIEQVDKTLNEKQHVWCTIKEPFNEEEEKLFERLVTLMGSKEGNEIPPMRNVDKNRLPDSSTIADTIFKTITLKALLH